ncbi:hypothetical protein OG791_34370 [Streptomyces canus]|nr:hypothetical protein [Streptomyces canus]
MLHVGELHAQAVGAGVVVPEVHLREAFGCDALELLLVGAGVPGLEQAVRPARRQGLGDVADPGVVGRAAGRFESEAGPALQVSRSRGNLILCFLLEHCEIEG